MKTSVLALAVTSLLFGAGSASGQSLYDRVNVYATGGKSNQNRHGQAEIESIHFEWGKALSARTELVLESIDYDTGLTADDFSRRELER